MGLGGIRIGGGRPPEDDFYFKNGVPVRLKTVRGFTPKEERIAKAYMQSLEDGRRTGIYSSPIASRYDRMMRERDPENYGLMGSGYVGDNLIDDNDREKIRQYIQQSILGGTMRPDVGQRLASQYGINSNLIGT